ncbi:AraC family transcriptional regulator [Thalassomonas haliotis]|uniref:Helix-turn-helix transcriptional regulator n=1 Tax=Thalassomonas haliotis TaxID=485448 RepID=A0ABY7V9H1_9GAMM|nr:AraC family transcriptional regulator [Thalassomonas haliotis]WDE10263.1 helix-turn-helix transcriptional regulator [Thalassomonas haliotis]
MKLFIKNMVCGRCKFVIENELKALGITPLSVSLGEVDFGSNTPEPVQLEVFRSRIETLGFELINDKKGRLIEQTKKHVIALVQQPMGEKVKLSRFLSEHIFKDYNYLSNLFSSVEGITIEQFYIQQKIEKVKELLVYDELSLTEIAFRLDYSSVAHLSNQFKKITGFTPSDFKANCGSHARKAIDKL